jgi:hypothetical protein
MGWKGTLRSVQASVRRAERDAQRRHRELERQYKQAEKMEAMERAALEVQLYENHISLLESVHRQCSQRFDWRALLDEPAPKEPTPTKTRQNAAKKKLASYKPGVMARLLKTGEKKREQLAAELDLAKVDDERATVPGPQFRSCGGQSAFSFSLG